MTKDVVITVQISNTHICERSDGNMCKYHHFLHEDDSPWCALFDEFLLVNDNKGISKKCEECSKL